MTLTLIFLLKSVIFKAAFPCSIPIRRSIQYGYHFLRDVLAKREGSRVLVASLAFAPCMGQVGPSFGWSASVQIRGGKVVVTAVVPALSIKQSG